MKTDIFCYKIMLFSVLKMGIYFFRNKMFIKKKKKDITEGLDPKRNINCIRIWTQKNYF